MALERANIPDAKDQTDWKVGAVFHGHIVGRVDVWESGDAKSRLFVDEERSSRLSNRAIRVRIHKMQRVKAFLHVCTSPVSSKLNGCSEALTHVLDSTELCTKVITQQNSDTFAPKGRSSRRTFILCYLYRKLFLWSTLPRGELFVAVMWCNLCRGPFVLVYFALAWKEDAPKGILDEVICVCVAMYAGYTHTLYRECVANLWCSTNASSTRRRTLRPFISCISNMDLYLPNKFSLFFVSRELERPHYSTSKSTNS